METPLSTRRVTRSQTAAASASSINKNTVISKRSDESNSKSRQQQETSSKNALLDITNNSPIVGVAKGNLLQTPSSACLGSRRRKISTTPGSGEAVLRDQVKTLLQKVEEEGGEVSKVEFRPLFFHHHHFVHSPMGLLLAPTPTNTPQVFTTLTHPQPNFTSQVVVNEEEEEEEEGMNSQITRSLLLDFSDKSEVIESCLMEEDCSSKMNAEEEEDSADDWSVQVNVSNTSNDETGEEGWSVVVDELCLGIENMDMELIKGRNHKRFIYNSDDDMVAEQLEDKLKGLLPTPQGKHIRFEEEEEDDDDANTTN